MVTTEAIAKEVLFPYLERDPGFRKEPEGMWNLLLKGLAGYEQDPKPVFAAIYRLNLHDPEKVIQRLPQIYDRFLESLAEQYVLGNKNIIKDFPWLQKGLFREKVEYFIDLTSAVAKVERERMKMELPYAYAAISEEITEEELKNVIAKQEREHLKQKFRSWDREMEEEEKMLSRNFEIPMDISYSYSFLKESQGRGASKKEPEEIFLLPEKASPAKKGISSTFLWIALISGILLLALVLWMLL